MPKPKKTKPKPVEPATTQKNHLKTKLEPEQIGYDPDTTFVLIDAHALIYRAYYAFPDLTTQDGTLVNAVFGFTKAVLTAIKDFEPEYLAVAFDHPKPTKRHKQFEAYKAHREKMPDDLIAQIGLIKDVVKALNFPTFEEAGWEADDLIGTLTTQAQAQMKSGQIDDDLLMVVVTGDKDTFQLVNDRVHVWLPGRGKLGVPREYDSAGVTRKMGLRPDQIIDMKALMGDASDNIPGIKGIGEKTAVALLSEFETLEAIYQAIEQQAAGQELPKAQQKLLKGAVLKKLSTGQKDAELSQDLATIQTDAPIDLKLEACRVSGYNKQEVMELFEELSFKSLIKDLPADDFELGLQEALW